MVRTLRPLAWFSVLLLVLALGPLSADVSPEGRRILDQLAQAQGQEYWHAVDALQDLGKDSLPVIEAGMKRPEAPVRIGCAKVLYTGFDRKKDAISALLEVMKEKNPSGQALAAELMAALVKDDQGYGDPDELGETLRDLLDASPDQRVKIALCKALWFASANPAATHELKELLEAQDRGVREEAALALAEMENYEAALDLLKKMGKEATERGRIARSYLRQKQLQEEIELTRFPSVDTSYELVDEVIKHVLRQYVDADKIQQKTLITAAARGVASALDPFSSYLDEEEKLRLKEGIEGKYGGIGAHVSMREEWLTIEKPVFGGPVDKAGLRPLDRIVEVEGETTYRKELHEVVSRLKGQAGTQVKVRIFRRGWAETREVVLTREQLKIDTAKGEMLPGKIGYAQVTSFGDETVDQLRGALEKFKESGVRSLIIDVRGNPGGYLQAARDVVDLFVEARKVVVTTKGRKGQVLETIETQDDDHIDLPCVVLINGGSASASEIFAGAMQDYKKAVIIGERSYGKGSVQHIIPLNSTNQATALRLTVAKYYLPSGRTPHREKMSDKESGGIKPDLTVELPKRDLWKDAEFVAILDAGELDRYFDRYYPANQQLFAQLAEFDNNDASRYPGFDELVATLKTKMSREEVRELLRDHVRRRVSHALKKEFLSDTQSDIQLQRAILELLKQVKSDPGAIQEYKAFVHKFDDPPKETGKK